MDTHDDLLLLRDPMLFVDKYAATLPVPVSPAVNSVRQISKLGAAALLPEVWVRR